MEKPKKKRIFDEAPEEDENFKLGFGVRAQSGKEGKIVAADRGQKEFVVVDFGEGPTNVLKKDLEVIQRKQHKW
jgi:hypothetical protein